MRPGRGLNFGLEPWLGEAGAGLLGLGRGPGEGILKYPSHVPI